MFFESIFSLFFEYKIFLFSLSLSYVFYHLVCFYQRVWRLPPGPIPLPIIGNILIFRSKDTWDKVLVRQSQIYGPVFTVWLGPEPIIFISDLDLGRDVFSKMQFSGRPQNFLTTLASNDKRKDIVCSSGEAWEVLRKVTHTAIQKYATNEKLSLLTSDCVRHTVNDIIAREGVDQEFSSYQYINSLVMNILANSVFGESYSTADEVSKLMKMLFESDSKIRIVLWGFSSVIRFLDRKNVKKYVNLLDDFINSTKEKFQNHYKDYDESIERDFCDALITAKKEALKRGKESAKHLTDDNLSMVILDLIIAGTATTVDTLQWVILFMTYYPEFQQKLRQEIETQIGDRIPTHADRNRCHFLMAFISETLRLKNVVPSAMPHTANEPGKIGNYLVPKGQIVFVFQDMILTNEKYWTNAQQFIPQRFLENGEYIKSRPKAYIPFGIGRRICPGEKLAMADMFLIIVRLLQLTSDYDLVLGSNGGLEPDPYFAAERPPHEFKIILKKRSLS